MTDKERMDYALLVRNVVEIYQSELRMAKLRLERQQSQYISAMLSYDKAVEKYEKRISELVSICENHGFSNSEIENLTTWRDGK